MFSTLVARSNQLVFPVLLVASLALNAYFAIELHKARRPPGPKTLAVGTPLRSLEVRAADGTSTTLQFDSLQPTVLYVMSPNCGWCSRNLPAVRSLVSTASPQFRFVAVSSEPLKAEQSSITANYPISIAGAVSENDRRQYGFVATPQTIVVRSGVVTASWAGAYVADVRKQVEEFFTLRLPNIAPSAPVR